MVFSSTIFLCFFLPIVLALYYLLPNHTLKNWTLLIASLFFYAWGEPIYVMLMLVSVLANYFFGLGIHHCHQRGKRGRLLLTLSVLLNLGLLFYFKYFNFAATVWFDLLGREGSVAQIALPIGISFYTFQGLSYVIDVYREDIRRPESIMVQKDPVKLALYISLFSQLIAGPIIRYEDIKPYLDRRHHHFQRFARGVEIFIIGLAKKTVFANLLGEVATSLMETNVQMISTPQAWLGALCYSMQIFYDFCGYSEMAIGLGKMFGFEFMKNFDYPYISCSVTEFWRRWHISLSQWFRDYLYIPLGGNRRGNVYFNLFVVFLATGVWHGAAWGFILWGLWHGAFMLIERLLKKHGKGLRLPKVLSWGYTMLVVMLGWVLFRIVDVPDTLQYLRLMFGLAQNSFVRYDLSWYLNARTVVVLVLAMLFCIPWKAILSARLPALQKVWEHPVAVAGKRVGLLVLLALCFLLIVNSTYNPFIYFRF